METEKRMLQEMPVRRNTKNEMRIEIDALSENEFFARVAVAAFVAPLNPTVEEISDIKTAVSEAVTNAVIHGYEEDGKQRENGKENKIYIHCTLLKDVLQVEVIDDGKGIANVEQAMEPLFTTKPDMDRSGMGFAFMEAFMDDLEVISEPGIGTTVLMSKKLGTLPLVEQEEM